MKAFAVWNGLKICASSIKAWIDKYADCRATAPIHGLVTANDDGGRDRLAGRMASMTMRVASISSGDADSMDLLLKEKIVEKLDEVPDAKLAEVMDFLEFLTWKAQQTQVSRPKPTLVIDSLQALRGRGRGERLVERLLRARQADRALDEQGHAHVRP